jgi:hypothetical protein
MRYLHRPPLVSAEDLTSSGVEAPSAFILIYMSDVQQVDIGRQIVVMECFGIQAFPFLRTRLKGLTSQ